MAAFDCIQVYGYEGGQMDWKPTALRTERRFFATDTFYIIRNPGSLKYLP